MHLIPHIHYYLNEQLYELMIRNPDCDFPLDEKDFVDIKKGNVEKAMGRHLQELER